MLIWILLCLRYAQDIIVNQRTLYGVTYVPRINSSSLEHMATVSSLSPIFPRPGLISYRLWPCTSPADYSSIGIFFRKHTVWIHGQYAYSLDWHIRSGYDHGQAFQASDNPIAHPDRVWISTTALTGFVSGTFLVSLHAFQVLPHSSYPRSPPSNPSYPVQLILFRLLLLL